nr:MAG TPA: restriction alleviation protein [Caudoviricetes sp.]
MKNEILKIAGEVLTDEDVNEIIKEKFKDAVRDACDRAFGWGDIKRSIEKKYEIPLILEKCPFCGKEY